MTGSEQGSSRPGRIASILARDIFPRPRASRRTPLGAKVCFALAWLQAALIWFKRDDISWYLELDWGVPFVVNHQWLLGFPIMLVGYLLGSLGQKIKAEHEFSWVVPDRRELAREIAEGVLDGSRPNTNFILFLRPFRFEGRLSVSNPSRSFVIPILPGFYAQPLMVDLESVITDAVWSDCPVVAIGGTDAVVGAGRIQSGEEWHELVRKLSHCARLIVFVPSDSPGCEWEAKTLLAEQLLGKTVFVMPPGMSAELWETTQKHWLEAGMNLPESQRAGELFKLDTDGQILRRIPLSNSKLRNLRSNLWSLSGEIA